MMTVFEKIKNILEKKKKWYEVFYHKPVRTSKEAASVRSGYGLHQGAKALILKIYPKNTPKSSKSVHDFFVMVVLAGDAKLDKGLLKRSLNIKNFRFATHKEVSNITGGVLPGGIPPFGNLFGLEVYLDSSLLDNEKIVFNAGDRGISIAMNLADYIELIKPRILGK